LICPSHRRTKILKPKFRVNNKLLNLIQNGGEKKLVFHKAKTYTDVVPCNSFDLNTLQFVGYGQLTLTELNFVSGPVISDLPEKEMVSYITSHPERFVSKNSVYVIRTRPLYWPGDILLKELRLLKKLGQNHLQTLKKLLSNFHLMKFSL